MRLRLSLPFLLISGLSVAGCHSWPKDSYIQGAKSTVNTPWGPSTLEAEILATGSAAKNISLPEIVAPAASPKKKQ